MKQEEKDLLLKDLSSRLPYGVKCIVTKSRIEEGQKGDVGKIVCVCLEGVDCIDISFFSEFGNFKPYLFPLSSMNEEQKNQLEEIWGTYMDKAIDYSISGEDELCDLCQLSAAEKVIDWLISNHFDFRGLIKKGLAIDATNIKVY